MLQVKVLVTLGSRTVNGRGHKGLLECRQCFTSDFSDFITLFPREKLLNHIVNPHLFFSKYFILLCDLYHSYFNRFFSEVQLIYKEQHILNVYNLISLDICKHLWYHPSPIEETDISNNSQGIFISLWLFFWNKNT